MGSGGGLLTISLRLFRRLLSSPLFRIAVLPAPSASTIGASLVNRLSDALSPYLRQHADNPVHWQPWDPQALAAARDSGRPILLSVGYSACHWCHVMAHESFEDQRLAALMNEHFVNIKVDREERPDVDALYMDALQAMTGRGGWPMTVFLTPEGLPFYGGTYFPPEARHGMAGFGEVLTAIAQAWEGRREAVLASAQRLADALRGAAAATGATQGPSPAALNAAAEAVAGAHDPRHGGFGAAPKFPQAPQLAFLAAYGRTFPLAQPAAAALAVVDEALDAMAGGGLFDQLGGGFHRYCVDADWTVPHFEKMLYDNALLLPLYLGQEARGKGRAPRRVAEATVGWLLREMRHPRGGFFTAQDADQEGGEGSFFVWRPSELVALLGAADGAWAAEQLGVDAAGNFEHGASVLTRRRAALAAADEARLDELGERLRAARDARPRPETDLKLLCGWNGLTIRALVAASRLWERADLRLAAEAAASFVLREMRLPDGGLAHVWRDGQAAVPAFLEDVAAMALACLDLAADAPDARWREAGLTLCDQLLTDFADPLGAVTLRCSPRHERLFASQKDLADGASPSGAALAAQALIARRRLTGETGLEPAIHATLGAAGPLLDRSPAAFSGLLTAAVDA